MKKIILFILLSILSINFSYSQIVPSKEEIYKVMTELKIHHQDIVMRQIILESGHMTSDLFKKNNNFLGIKKGKNYAKYSHWRECLKDYKERIQNRYKDGENYYHFLSRIGYAGKGNDKYNQTLKRIKL